MDEKMPNVEKSNRPHPLTVKVDDNSSTMIISSRPNHLLEILGFCLLAAIMVALFSLVRNSPSNRLFSNTITLVALSIALLWLLFSALNQRTLFCIFRKKTGRGTCIRGGFAGSNFLRKEFDFSFSDIVRLETHYQKNRRSDAFRIYAVLQSGESLDLSGESLDYAKCQKFVEEIKDFINPKLLIKAIDDESFTDEEA